MKRTAWIAIVLLALPFALLAGMRSGSAGEVLLAVRADTGGRVPLGLGDGITVVARRDHLLLAVAEDAAPAREGLEARGLRTTVIDRDPRAKDDYYLLATTGPVDRASAGAGVVPLDTTEGLVVFRASPTEAAAFRDAVESAAGVHACGSLARLALRPIRPMVERPVPGEHLTLPPDPVVQALVDQVDQTELETHVQALQDIGGRRYDSPGGIVAQNMIVGWFQALATPENGLTVTTQHFLSGSHDNVIATLPGSVSPDEYVIIGAHYDSTCGGCAHPYGADDNATGSATVLEAARILSQSVFERTVVFCCWGAEEIGLVGSDYYATQARQGGDDIYGYLNFDMNGYLKPGNSRQFSVATNSSSASLIQELKEVRDTYVSEVPWVTGVLTAGSSDHASFTGQGYRACFPFEHFTDYSPYIHTEGDVIGPSVNDFGQSVKFARLGVAAIATWAAPFDGFAIRHEALADTSDNMHRRTVTARIIATEGVQSAELVWSNGGAGEVVVPMTVTGNPDEYEATIPAHPHGVQVSYYLRATDGAGSEETLPAGAPLEQFSYTTVAETTYFFDDMESGAGGWTHQQVATQDDWMLGPPNQQGDNPYDPLAAWSGDNVWGNDLNPPGFQGNYADNVHNYLRSPAIDLSAASGSILRYRRWLSVEDGVYDQATIEVNGAPVWQNQAGGDHVDTSWVSHEIDISALADGNPSVQITFRLQSDSFVTFGGWNVDDVEIYAPGDPDSLGADQPNPPLGTTIHFTISAPGAGGLDYELYASKKTTPGIDVDGERVIPLREDGTYRKVNDLKDSGHPWITDFRGTLDANGGSTAPALFIPDRPRFSGARFFFSGVVRDGASTVAVLPFAEIQIQ